MQIFKFGGASVKDAINIRNVGHILATFKEIEKVVVVSALGKTTNALEEVVNAYIDNNDDYTQKLHAIYSHHVSIANELGIPTSHHLYDAMHAQLEQVIHFLSQNHQLAYTLTYDQVVPLGELLSTLLLDAYLNEVGIASKWFDARDFITTNENYTEAIVDFNSTETKMKAGFHHELLAHTIAITQGFIGKNPLGFSTTLGREGSDYTASVFAYCLDAEKVVIWKDVPAVLNADPRLFKDTIKIEKLTYREAIEMTYYGAQVIHPKTIKPLQNKKIPLQVRSFIELENEGTLVTEIDHRERIHYPPIIVYKTNQALISISVKDFSFVTEDNMSIIFQCFSKHGLRMNMTHSGAIRFSVCTEYKEERIKLLIAELEMDFEVKYNINLEMLTIRHYTEEKIHELTADKEILLQEKTRNTIQFLMRKRP
jgi:aspartate kinase